MIFNKRKIDKKPYFSYKKLLLKIANLPSRIRKLILLLIDLISLFITIILSNLLLYKFLYFNFSEVLRDFFLFSCLAIPIYLFFGQYKDLTKFISKRNIHYFLYRNLLVSIILTFFIDNLIYLFAISISQTFLSFFIRNIIANISSFSRISKSKKIVIYGAGEAGAKFANSLILNKENEILFFIDDNPSLWSRSILRIPIKSKTELEKYKNEIDILFLAIPTISSIQKKVILNDLYKYPFKVMIIPSLEEILSGKLKISEARSVRIEDLIYRDIAKIDRSNITKTFSNKTILITGAGGSIGSVITSQIYSVNPKIIIALDFSEFNLYSLKNKLIDQRNKETELIFTLGNCCDQKLIDEIFNKYSIDILIHCAAYKHVPMVENNPLVGLSNNICATRLIAKAAIKNNVHKAVLISTDKAVRPTNIMGVSKRIAEMIFLHSQNVIASSKESYDTKFSIVRFGNVLGSSGSVVPLFNEQIKKGGPITITHPEITRYFMTIEEAAILVLEAASFSKGGELYLLDMGKPIKIVDLAKKLIKLNGLKVRNALNREEDIEIKFIGLREGEKLFEELLIDGDATRSQNKYIYLARESKVIFDNSKLKIIDELIEKINYRDKKNALFLLKKLVPEWQMK